MPADDIPAESAWSKGDGSRLLFGPGSSVAGVVAARILALDVVRRDLLLAAIFLAAGILGRIWAINQPIIDAHMLRQGQTADATRYLSRQATWHLSSEVGWLGDHRPHLLQEIPVYNYLVVFVNRILGDLDRSAKLVSIILWAASFCVLQGLWRRMLVPAERPWANLLFVTAPLSVFFGQAFMPEMLVQVLAFAFVLCLLRYVETRGPTDFVGMCAASLVAALTKLPAVSHLYVLAAALIALREQGWWRRGRYWVAAFVTVLAIYGWAQVVNEVNSPGMQDWTASESLRGFVGSFGQRLAAAPYMRMVAYLVAFVLGPVGAWFAAVGCAGAVRERRVLLVAWTASLVFFYGVWGIRTAATHSYYSLAALGPLCGLFGVGVARQAGRAAEFNKWRKRLLWAAALLFAAWQVGGSWYLFRQDRVIYDSALWIRQHTDRHDETLLIANHHPSMIDYPHVTVFPYYAERTVWVWTSHLAESDRHRVLQKARWVVVTEAPASPDMIERIRRAIRGDAKPPTSTAWLPASGFVPFYRGAGFSVYARQGRDGPAPVERGGTPSSRRTIGGTSPWHGFS